MHQLAHLQQVIINSWHSSRVSGYL